MDMAGLTASLGAFLAGMLLADSDYRHELEADIEPFKGLLMGLFFIAVGMSANLGLLAKQPLQIAAIVAGVIAIKFVLLYTIGRLAGTAAPSARKLGLALAQGGEFAFVLFAAAAAAGIIATAVSQMLVVAVTVSMLIAPLLFVLEDKLLAPALDRREEREFDTIEAPDAPQGHVVIAGYGRVGQIVARVLSLKGIAFVALEKDADQVDSVRKFGGKLYFGDATRLELLQAANVANARLFVLAIDDPEDSVKCAQLVRHNFPALPIIARARNRTHVHRLADMGVTRYYRETWYASLEMALQSLLQLRVLPSEAATTIARFRDHDLALLKRQHAIYTDEGKLIQTTREASEELLSLFEADREQDGEILTKQ
jgi:glutathione-regulated potassium-efflux system ancillary protein KefC/glutathione-regulated potassium-efflux system protein KefB